MEAELLKFWIRACNSLLEVVRYIHTPFEGAIQRREIMRTVQQTKLPKAISAANSIIGAIEEALKQGTPVLLETDAMDAVLKSIRDTEAAKIENVVHKAEAYVVHQAEKVETKPQVVLPDVLEDAAKQLRQKASELIGLANTARAKQKSKKTANPRLRGDGRKRGGISTPYPRLFFKEVYMDDYDFAMIDKRMSEKWEAIASDPKRHKFSSEYDEMSQAMYFYGGPRGGKPKRMRKTICCHCGLKAPGHAEVTEKL